jgi:phosphoesterase RecJ-like protein
MPEYTATAKSIGEKIRQAEHVVVALHPYPDGDSIGSCLGLKHLTEQWGKKVTVLGGDSALPTDFAFLPGFGDIQPLPVTLASFTSIGADPANTIFIALDVGAVYRVSADVPAVQAVIDTFPTYVIDHHTNNEGFGKENLIISSAAATAEMLVYIAEQWNIPLSPLVARCLMLGLYTDTGGFRHGSTTAHTLASASTCASIYSEYTKDIATLENNRSRTDIILQGLAFLAAEEISGGGAGMAMVSHAMMQEHLGKDIVSQPDITAGVASAVATILKSVKGWNVAACGYEIAPDKVKVSFRSRDGAVHDVAAAAASLGGGGHRAAAAVILTMSFAQAKAAIHQALATLVHSTEAK